MKLCFLTLTRNFISIILLLYSFYERKYNLCFDLGTALNCIKLLRTDEKKNVPHINPHYANYPPNPISSASNPLILHSYNETSHFNPCNWNIRISYWIYGGVVSKHYLSIVDCSNSLTIKIKCLTYVRWTFPRIRLPCK